MRMPAVFGATGSLGRCVCGVLASNGSSCAHLAGWRSHDTLAGLVTLLCPRTVSFHGTPSPALGAAIEESGARRVMTTADALEGADGAVVVSSGIGGAGPMLEAIRRNMPVAAGNKEAIVAFGRLIMGPGRGPRPDIRPVDSEHAAAATLIGLLPEGAPVDRLVITGTGGAVRDVPEHLRHDLPPSRVLEHPVWSMGAKITVDSATLVNKALEVVEASMLFGLPGDRISVLFDRDAAVHAAVESVGNTTAFKGPADMSGPVRMALGLPPDDGSRVLGGDEAARALASLTKPDGRAARSIALGHAVLASGGCSPMALVLADEAAVHAFLAGRMRFGDIVPFIELSLEKFRHASGMDPESPDDLEGLVREFSRYAASV